MDPLSVAILVGGASRRMGQDKALLSLRPGDPPLIGLVINGVKPLTDDLFLVGPNRPGYDQFEIPIVPDPEPRVGPLGGIAAALGRARHEACLIVACDMPFLSRALLEYMAGLPRDSYDALIPRTPADPTDPASPLVFQPLHAIYQRSCLEPILRHLASGRRRVSTFFPDVRLRTLSAEEAYVLDPDLRSFAGVNTPQAVEQASSWLANSPAGPQTSYTQRGRGYS
jgi:molybdenum cofactor guanylyltransferase